MTTGAAPAGAKVVLGLDVGTTSGELWMSRNEGRHWGCIARHLPEIYAVEAAVVSADGKP